MTNAEKHTYNGEGTRAWEEIIEIPTYTPGSPDRNPMFLEKRVYQGSSGAVYPYQMIHSVSDEKIQKTYRALFLENRYLKIMILPELGGRVQMALDKTSNYHFVYYNRVIKPALVGLAGPWISGGIEFNWPQHHRPTTFSSTEYEIETHPDNSTTIWIAEWEPMFRTRSVAGFRLYSNRAVLEINGRVSNPTPFPQTFLWWANPAVAVNDNYQAVFPPDVTAVFDHGKRDLSRFPIATGTYYKVDYSSGVDISWYKNVTVPTSYMAYHSDYDFVGGYDHGKQSGILHVADHHVSPGKKMWTWGTADFGHAWEKNLTDEDGPYVELMTGVYTDNQPDFTWLQPGEEKQFTQYFFPFHGIHPVTVANEQLVIGITTEGDTKSRESSSPQEQQEVTQKSKATVSLYATSPINTFLTVEQNGTTTHEVEVSLETTESFTWEIDNITNQEEFIFHAKDLQGKEILRYPAQTGRAAIPAKKAVAAPKPQKVANNEELFFWGRHLEQYRHATFSPDPFYNEILKRDPEDSRANNALGLRALKRGMLNDAERYFRHAVDRLLQRNPNPYDGEPLFNLGLVLWYQKQYSEAFDWFFKATWNYATRSAALYYMARIKCIHGRWAEAIRFLDDALSENTMNFPAAHLRTVAIRKSGKIDTAKSALNALRKKSPVHHLAYAEEILQNWPGEWPVFFSNKPHLIIEIVLSYGHSGCIDDALTLIQRYKEECERSSCTLSPLPFYLSSYYQNLKGDKGKAIQNCNKAEQIAQGTAFPNQVELIVALESLLNEFEKPPMAAFELGNFYYAHGAYKRAHTLWESAVSEKPDFAPLHRNLALSFFNKKKDKSAALQELETAFALDTHDAQILLELDVLAKRLNHSIESRLQRLESNKNTVMKRDDLIIAFVTLLNLSGRNDEALDILLSHQFHPWEGGEGTLPEQYKRAKIELAKSHIEAAQFREAIEQLEGAKIYPRSLGEGKLPTSESDNEINFWLGFAYTKIEKPQGNTLGKKAEAALIAASEGDDTPQISFYYNDRPADAIFYQALASRVIGNESQALRLLHRLRDYGESHLHEHIEIDFFAVSLPDFLVFEEDLDQRNYVFCRYLIGLGCLGLGNYRSALQSMEKVTQHNTSHPGSIYTKPLISSLLTTKDTGYIEYLRKAIKL